MSALSYSVGSVRTNTLKRQRYFPAVYIGAIALAEYLFAYHDVAYGVIMCLFLVTASYLLLSTVELDPLIARCIEAISLAPTYILFTASLPWFAINQEYLLPGVYSVILALVLWHIYRRRYSTNELKGMGFLVTSPLKHLAIGLALALPTGLVEYLILRPDPSGPSFVAATLLRDMVYMFVFVAVAEEVLFRGIIQKVLMDALGLWPGILVTSLLFAAMHMSWRSVPELFFVFLASIMLGYLRIKTRSLIGPLAWHGMNNTMLVGILPYLLN